MAVTSRTPSVSVSGAPSAVSGGPSAVPGIPSQPGLRERKKLKTRTAIRRAAYRLIAEQGYETTTIEQIAEAAEVSPSTVCRYFATKEDIVLTDAYGPVLEAGLRERPAGEPPLESLRIVMTEMLPTFLVSDEEEVRRRTRLVVEVPAVRARMTETMSDTARMLARVLAERSGRGADDLVVRVFVAAALGVLREVTLYWGEHGQKDDLPALVRQALDALGDGLTL
ncbi:TetR/AcrR family transcriptional regulator [Streptomyces sp. NPDC001750]|uniref:TetR/AcrR family transcriptional regulator n=1 Tax=Streptomyces sp. NPDC001750 TaxID=3364607 RepID=UPI0036C656BC